MRKLGTKFVAISLLLAVGAVPGFSRAQSSTVYNGHWWLSVTRNERDGFLNGYADCYIFNFHGPLNYGVQFASPEDVTRYYESHRGVLGMPVAEVLHHLPPPAAWRVPSGGEVVKGPHSYYTGRWWGVTGYQTDLGYVGGFLWCWRNCLHNKGGTFSKTPEEYVKLIDTWYQVNPKNGINARREPTPIAYVLYSFRDRKQPPQAKATYNGHWWLSVSRDERDGFLNGYFDCYTYTLKGPAKFENRPPAIARHLVTSFYTKHKGQLGLPVADVFLRFRDRPGESENGSGGEPIHGAHGYFTGQWWGATYQTDLGYVEGYLWCWRNCLHNKGGTFSKTAEEYVKLIDAWYQVNPKTTINARREPTPIAYVLYSFRDGQQSPHCSEK